MSISNDDGVLSRLKRMEIELKTNCNRITMDDVYTYCPNSTVLPISPPKVVDDDLYKKIITQLRELNFSGRISYHFYGEPLLHPRLEAILEYSSSRLPNTQQALYTNGDFLDDNKYRSIRALGQINIIVSKHSRRAISDRPLSEICLSEEMQKVRENWRQDDDINPCEYCDNQAHMALGKVNVNHIY